MVFTRFFIKIWREISFLYTQNKRRKLIFDKTQKLSLKIWHYKMCNIFLPRKIIYMQARGQNFSKNNIKHKAL